MQMEVWGHNLGPGWIGGMSGCGYNLCFAVEPPRSFFFFFFFFFFLLWSVCDVLFFLCCLYVLFLLFLFRTLDLFCMFLIHESPRMAQCDNHIPTLGSCQRDTASGAWLHKTYGKLRRGYQNETRQAWQDEGA